MQQLRPGQGHGVQAGAEAGEGGVQPRADDLPVPGMGRQRDREAQLGERHRGEMVRARARALREEAEAPLEDLEGRQTGDLDTDKKTELLENIKRSHELLEAERRVFEDLEFRQMEKEPSLEAEMEDGGQNVEAEAGDVAGSWRACRARGRTSTASPSWRRRAPDLETLLRQLLVGSRSERNSEDSGTWAEAESEAARVSVWVENNITKRTT